jgi:predicted unusual protein kinase regulating ubiquinone biosynthesis (AarF/ABC1/UbiB family)
MVQAAVARLEGVVVPEHLPERVREPVLAAIERARAETAGRLPVSEVERQLEGELDSLDDHPESVEAHAQTHRAVLDGVPVRVKAGRPGLAASARSDLSLLDLMAGPAKAAFPTLDVGPLIREVRERAVDELDFEHEAALQRRVARALRPVEGVGVARVVLDQCSECVAMAEQAAGTALSDSNALDGVDRSTVARRLVTVFCGAPGALGMVLADARAAETYVSPAGEVTLQWVGAGREVDPLRLEAAVGAAQALRIDDPEAFALALKAMGLLERDDALRAHALLRELLGPLVTGPALLDADAVRAAGDRALDRADELLGLAMRVHAQPEDLWGLRALAHTISLLAQVGAEEDWLALGVAAVRKGWA